MIGSWNEARRGDPADRDYLTQRAEQERERAKAATDIGVALAHRRMAEAYEQRLASLPENA